MGLIVKNDVYSIRNVIRNCFRSNRLFTEPLFRAEPKGERLERMKQSPNCKNGAF